MIQPSVHIKSFTEPAFGENGYVVDLGIGGECWVVDPGLPPAPRDMLAHIAERRLKPAAIVLTHGHADHIAGHDAILAAHPGLPTYIAAADRIMLSDAGKNLSMLGGFPIACHPSEVRDLEPPGPLMLGETAWQVLDTSGHAPGGRSLYCADVGVVLVGDALFADSIGRTDFPGSDHDTLIRNIRKNLFTLPDDTVVLSGHGPKTTIGRERRFNPFLT